MNDKKKSHDVLGVQPLAKAVEIATKGAVDGAAAFLSRICLPAAEEFGLLLKERVSHWRTQNLVAIINKTESLLQEHGGVKNLKAHPKIINEILEKGSWTDDSNIQEMWAGLLASSCTQDGSDESNLVFVNLLGQITSAQARFLNHACLNTQKKLSIDNLVYAKSMNISPIQLVEIWRDSDLHRIDRELDHLRALELIKGGFPLHDEEYVERLRETKKMKLEQERMDKKLKRMDKELKSFDQSLTEEIDKKESDKQDQSGTDQTPIEVEIPPFKAEVTPTGIALHLFVRCQGSHISPTEFFGLATSDDKET